MAKNLSFYELTKYRPSELKSKYRMNEKQFEQQVQRHCADAPKGQMQEFYKNVYDDTRK